MEIAPHNFLKFYSEKCMHYNGSGNSHPGLHLEKFGKLYKILFMN